MATTEQVKRDFGNAPNEPDEGSPVSIGDRLGSEERFKLLRKLEDTRSGTTWLGRDFQKDAYVSLRVLNVHASRNPCFDSRLSSSNLQGWSEHDGIGYLAPILDQFWIKGAAKPCLCKVLPPLGPSISTARRLKSLSADTLRKLCLQVVLGFDLVHCLDVCHGDFRPSNIHLKLKELDQASEEQINQLLGQVTSPSSELDWSSADPSWFRTEIYVSGSESYFDPPNPPENILTPLNFCPPEVLLGGGRCAGYKGEDWALGCTLFEIWTGSELFSADLTCDGLIHAMVSLFGIPPESVWRTWKDGDRYFDPDYLPKLESNISMSIETLLQERFAASSSIPNQEGTQKEALLLADLLRQLMRYSADDRMRADEAKYHEVFTLH